MQYVFIYIYIYLYLNYIYILYYLFFYNIYMYIILYIYIYVNIYIYTYVYIYISIYTPWPFKTMKNQGFILWPGEVKFPCGKLGFVLFVVSMGDENRSTEVVFWFVNKSLCPFLRRPGPKPVGASLPKRRLSTKSMELHAAGSLGWADGLATDHWLIGCIENH